VAEEEGSEALAVAEEEGSRLFVSAGFSTGRTALGAELLPVDEENSFEKNYSFPGLFKKAVLRIRIRDPVPF
jgi:hypothetical protein